LTIQGRSSFSGQDFEKLSFIIKRIENGKQVTRIAHNGVLAMETMVPGVGQNGVILRQVTDGHHIAKLVYSDVDTIETCDVLKNDVEEITDFLSQFTDKKEIDETVLEESELVKHLQNGGSEFSVETVRGRAELTPAHQSLLDLAKIRQQCHENHQEVKQKLRDYKKSQQRMSKEFNTDEEKIQLEVVEMEGKGRSKRDTGLIFPGTKWCGKGSVGEDFEDLGPSRQSDKCCRAHDFCPYYIEGTTRKYGYYNFRFTTMIHCDCDERFRTCLKFQNTPVADSIGELYFNRLATKCFTFTQERVCAKRTWYLKCTEWKQELTAVIQDPIEY